MSNTEIVIVIAALLVGGLVKSVTGMGLPLITVPIMAMFVSVEDAVIVIAAPNVAMNAWLVWRERAHRHETRDLGLLVSFGVVGAVLGAFLLSVLPERAVLLGLAAMVIAYLARLLHQPDASIGPQTSARWSPFIGFGAGVSQGAVGISGPIVATWIHAYRLSPGAYIFSITTMFAVSASAQLIVFAADGRLFDRLTEISLTFIPVFAVLPFGSVLRQRLSGTAFDRAVLAVLAISATALIVRALG